MQCLVVIGIIVDESIRGKHTNLKIQVTGACKI